MEPQLAAPEAPDESEILPRLARVAIAALGVLVIGAWLFLALVHLGDHYNVNAVSGTLLALADRARDGVLYPPFFDGQSYGGTRTMPLPILLYGFAMSMGGDIVASAKLVDFAAAAGLVLLLIAILRRQGAGMVLSVALASTVVSSQVFLLTGAGIRPEALPTVLQLGAVALVAFVPRRAAVVVAGVLCAIALFAKLTALWAPAAIALWLLSRDRGRMALFVAVTAVAAAALAGLFVVASEGRMLTNLLGLGGAGISIVGIAKAPLKAVQLLLQHAQAGLVLLPLLLGSLFVGRAARPSIFTLGFLAAGVILLVVMADLGSDYNHLLDVVVLLPIVAHESIRSLARRMPDPRPAWAFLAGALLVGSATALAMNAGSTLAAAIGLPGTSTTTYDPRLLAGDLGGAPSVLAEDPYFDLARGARPVVLDAFMLIRLERRDAALVEPLLARLETGGFDAVVLTRDLDEPGAEGWYRDFAFGSRFYDAARAGYRRCAFRGGLYLYAPSSRPCPAT